MYHYAAAYTHRVFLAKDPLSPPGSFSRSQSQGKKQASILYQPGTACTAEQVKALAAVARKHKLLVLSDEIYDVVQFDGKHESFAKHYPEGTILLTGISKTSGAGGQADF